jgi:hypothetical protein
MPTDFSTFKVPAPLHASLYGAALVSSASCIILLLYYMALLIEKKAVQRYPTNI